MAAMSIKATKIILGSFLKKRTIFTCCLVFLVYVGHFILSDPKSSTLYSVKKSVTLFKFSDGILQRFHEKRKYNETYLEALTRKADKNGVIILLYTDVGYVDFALNLYFTSFKKLNIGNFLYVTSSSAASKVLDQHGIDYFMFCEDKEGREPSDHGTPVFHRKTIIKTKIILEALKLKFTVLVLDADIVIFKNPFPFLSCSDCDIQIQNEWKETNCGFYLARPTEAVIHLLEKSLQTISKNRRLRDQYVIDKTMKQMGKKKKIKFRLLPFEEFKTGDIYYEKDCRVFAGDNPCNTCVAVHNNFLQTSSAKEYRFKEYLLWNVDTNGYYSDKNAKYLTYENPFDFGHQTTKLEIEALKTALVLGYLLKRIVILPAFHCYGSSMTCAKLAVKHGDNAAKCSLQMHIKLSVFNKAFPNAYREHVFLQHPYVPKKILSSQSPKILIKTDMVMSKLGGEQVMQFKYQFPPLHGGWGTSSLELVLWLEPLSTFKVLRFHSLYSAFNKFNPQYLNNTFKHALKNGLHKSNYHQLTDEIKNW